MTDFSSLRGAVSGVVLTPSDADFAGEVTGFNLAVQSRPEVVVGAASTDDIIAAVRFASEHGLPVRVQSTGHGAQLISDGMLISTKRLDAVAVDPDTRIATIGAGARWAAVIAAADPFGLAPITGGSASVGAVGYLLGGGLGPLARSHGFSSDWVRAFTVVTADGELVTASADEHPDLFWALRGGKGGLGVVTEALVELAELPELYAGALMFEGEAIEPALRAWAAFTATAPDDMTTSAAIIHFPPMDFIPEIFRGKGGLGVVTEAVVELAELPELYAGALMFEGEAIEPALRAWAAFTETAPDEVTTSAAIIHFPPMDFIPEIFRGKDILAVRFARPGDAATGELLAAPLRAAATPLVDGLRPLPRADVALIHNDPSDPGPSWGAGMMLDHIDDAFIDLVLANFGAGLRGPFMVTEVRHLGAATSRDVDGGSAVGGRDASYAFTVIGRPDPSLFAEALPGALAELKPQLAPWLSSGTNIHWIEWGSDADYERSWPADVLARLRAVRAEVDPQGRFPFGVAAD